MERGIGVTPLLVPEMMMKIQRRSRLRGKRQRRGSIRGTGLHFLLRVRLLRRGSFCEPPKTAHRDSHSVLRHVSICCHPGTF